MRRPSHYNVPATRDLTPRQREVLVLMAAGKTNGQIADALGITIDGAKFHVSEILSRLDVSTREEAVAVWRAGSRPSARFRAVLGSLFAHKLLAGATAVIAVAAAGIAVAFALNGDDGPATAQAPTITAIAAAAQRPGFVLHMSLVEKGPAGENSVDFLYSPYRRALRADARLGPDLVMSWITTDGHRTQLWRPLNQLKTVPIFPAAGMDPALAALPHLELFSRANTVSYRGEQIVDGQPLLRFDTTATFEPEVATGSDTAPVQGSAIIFLRPSDLLPARIESQYAQPDGTVVTVVQVLESALVAAASIPAYLFDPGAIDRLP